MLAPHEMQAVRDFPPARGGGLGTYAAPTAELEILRLRGVVLRWRKDLATRALVAELAHAEDAPILRAIRDDIAAWRAAHP